MPVFFLFLIFILYEVIFGGLVCDDYDQITEGPLRDGFIGVALEFSTTDPFPMEMARDLDVTVSIS